MRAARGLAPSAVLAALALAGGLVGLAACRRDAAPPSASAGAAADDSPVVLRVGDETVTRAELDQRWRQLTPEEQSFHGARARETGLASGRAHLLDEIADEILLAQEARRRGMDARPDVRAAVRSVTNRLVARPLLAEEVRRAAVPRSELEAWYAQHGEEFGQPARVELFELVVTSLVSRPGDDTADAAAARAKIDRLRARVTAGEDFESVAREASEVPSQAYGGRLGWVVAGRYAREWESRAFALQAGQISEVLEVPEGFALLWARSRDEGSIPPLAEVEDQVLSRILADDEGSLQRRYNVFVGELRSKTPVEARPDLLEEAAGGVSGPAPSDSGEAAPGG